VLEELSEPDLKLLDNSLKLYHSAQDDTNKINALNNICENMLHDAWVKYNMWVFNFIEGKLKAKHSTQTKRFLKKSLAASINNIGITYDEHGDIPKAIFYYKKSMKIQEELGNTIGIAYSLNNLANVYTNQGDIPLALEYNHKALTIREKLKDKKGIATSLNNIASIYSSQGDVSKSLKFNTKALFIREEINDKYGIAMSLNNIGLIYKNKGDISKAIEFYNKSLNIKVELGDKNGIANSYNNIAMAYRSQGIIDTTLIFLYKSLEMREMVGHKLGIILTLNNISSTEYNRGNIIAAERIAKRGLIMGQEIGYPGEIKNSAKLLSDIYKKQNKGIKALKMFKLYVTMSDSIYNEATQKASVQQQAQYEYEKQKAIDDAEHDKLLAIEQEEKEKQKILSRATAGGLGLVVMFLIFVFNRLRVTKKQKLVIEEQKREVVEQKEVVEAAHNELEEKNQEIMDSITYAKRIQSAILPPDKIVKEYLKESFILYKPKDIVAGDFYWMEHVKNKVLFAAADCTGHGVPGAMVSVVCNNALNRSVREHGLTDPGEILTKTREIVIQEFEKSDEEVKDGMDIALCSLEGNKLQYAGAHNPLWIIRNGEIIETKANKQPIGQFDNPEPYTTHSFDLQEEDSIYIFSDGYVDQFGGEKGKKFKSRAFRDLLLSIQDKNMAEQITVIDEAFETWRGDLEQIDDVCVIGVKI